MIPNKLSSKVFCSIILGGVSTALIVTIGLIIKPQQLSTISDRNIAKSSIPKKYDLLSPIKTLIPEKNSHLTNNRTTYLLALDLLKQNRGKQALKQLQNLEQEYPLLAPYILLKRGKAYELEKNFTQARETWQKSITKYSTSPAIVEALYLLGRDNPSYWEQAITQFPYVKF